jgi:hypothetical protein
LKSSQVLTPSCYCLTDFSLKQISPLTSLLLWRLFHTDILNTSCGKSTLFASTFRFSHFMFSILVETPVEVLILFLSYLHPSSPFFPFFYPFILLSGAVPFLENSELYYIFCLQMIRIRKQSCHLCL